MHKEKYEQTELEIIVFQSADIITTSGYRGLQEDEGEMMPGHNR